MRRVELKYGKERIVFDVMPEELTVKESRIFRRWELIAGEYSSAGGRGLKSVMFDAVIPGDGRSYADAGLPQAGKLALLDAWKDADGAIEVTVSDEDGSNIVVYGRFYITMLSKCVREGDSDVSVGVELIEARYPAAQTGGTQSGEGGSGETGYYTVKKGDCLWHIAQRHYGTGGKWRVIYDANKATIGCNPNLIYPGQKLVLP